jgi:hypothetical protein
MKSIITIVLISLSAGLYGQTITSVSNGNASNPFVWSCTCIPPITSNIVINHVITMDSDWYHTGTITVSASGQWIQQSNQDVLFDGPVASFVNNGHTELTYLGLTNGASGSNTGQMTLDSGFYSMSDFTNQGSVLCDSMVFQGDFTQTSSGYLFGGDFLFDGNVSLMGTVHADSLLNTGLLTLQSGSYIYTYDISNTDSMVIEGELYASHNMSNFQDLVVDGIIGVDNDFTTGDLLDFSASLVVDGRLVVINNWASSQPINGTGEICIGGASSNASTITGTLDICDPTGTQSGFDTNIGSVAGTITNCASGCYAGVAEKPAGDISVYPNPASDVVFISGQSDIVRVFTVDGSLVMEARTDAQGILHILELAPGMYLLRTSTAVLPLLVSRH